MRVPVWCAWFVVMTGCAAAPPGPLVSYRIESDAINQPLAAPGDAARGRDVLMGRESNCLLCHAVPETGARFMGNIAPSLSGVAGRLSEGQLRLRIVDLARLNRDTVMPSYYRTEGLSRVAPAYRGKPILSAQQIEDVVAYLRTLQ
ncbi:MAG: sulfur oxidation c-type cytochrome SoxX [Burkholderiales bacterium]|nr:sulfur oxidation c-type cytochrome SoxX [Burkholderiales bacterium]